MSKKSYTADEVPSLIAERLQTWGQCIRKQRLTQRIQAVEMCQRLGISHPTLLRLQRGEPGVGVGLYLSAMLMLGVRFHVCRFHCCGHLILYCQKPFP